MLISISVEMRPGRHTGEVRSASGGKQQGHSVRLSSLVRIVTPGNVGMPAVLYILSFVRTDLGRRGQLFAADPVGPADPAAPGNESNASSSTQRQLPRSVTECKCLKSSVCYLVNTHCFAGSSVRQLAILGPQLSLLHRQLKQQKPGCCKNLEPNQNDSLRCIFPLCMTSSYGPLQRSMV
jgi:hypothetical protein